MDLYACGIANAGLFNLALVATSLGIRVVNHWTPRLRMVSQVRMDHITVYTVPQLVQQ